MLGEQRYFDGGGNAVGLTKAEEETGVGCINIDNGFDTTYTCYLEDCNEEEINCLLMSNDYKSSRLEEALKAFETETEE